MIPVYAREAVTHTDEDGIIWKFKPKTGLLEHEAYEVADSLKDTDNLAIANKTAEFIDKILVSWDDPKGRLTKEKIKPSELLNVSERFHVFGYWHKANELTVEEKKV